MTTEICWIPAKECVLETISKAEKIHLAKC